MWIIHLLNRGERFFHIFFFTTIISVYYDIESLVPNVDFINLWAFDKKTPLRNPKSADVTAPIYENFNGIADDHLDRDVT